MKCLHPIKIVNQQKYLNLATRELVTMYVPCGHCVACQKRLRNEWYVRAMFEFSSTIESGGYVLFDCLTYSEDNVPRVSHYYNINDDSYCFDYKHLRLFMVRLRKALRAYDVKSNLRYFAATEYGTHERGTHRPHIHILFFVKSPSLSPDSLSSAVSSCWQYGRTDGLPYKSEAYVRRNTIGNDYRSSSRVCKYICKYIVKDIAYNDNLNRRKSAILHSIHEQSDESYLDYDKWIKMPSIKRLSRSIDTRIGQFHRQSLHFGECYLRDVDINDIMRDNIVKIADTDKVMMRLALPTYYKRKLFFKQIKIDGVAYWCPTELGKQYIELRKIDMTRCLTDDYNMYCKILNIDVDVDRLVDYVVNYRGRLKADTPALTLEEKISCNSLIYSYISSSDKEHFKIPFLSATYQGNKKGFFSSIIPCDAISLREFIAKYVYYNAGYEVILQTIDEFAQRDNVKREALHANKQRLEQLYKNM